MGVNLASLEKATKQHAEKLVLDEVSLGVDDGERVGVIGVNGSGKSTLLRLIAGLTEPDSGRVVLANHARAHFLAQEPGLDPQHTPLEAVLGADTREARAVAEFERASGAVRAAPDDAEAQARLVAATREMDAAQAWDLEHRGRSLLGKLGIGDTDQAVGSMSGGQRKRVALARALASPAELLILDEPTNHLDVEVIEWLEGVLLSRSGALLIVTHDRYLLDRIATRIVEIDGGRVHTQHGSYADYLQARALREEQAAAAERKRSNLARTELEWLRRGPKARTSKAKYRVERATELVERKAEDPRGELAIGLPARRIGSKVVNLHSAGKSYDGRAVLRDVDYKLGPGERIGIVGPNGSGKTTLLRLIAGLEEPDEGSVRAGETVHIGWYGQDPRTLPADTRVLDAVKEVVLETNTVEGITLSAGQLLERFLFPPAAQRAYVSELSGGERRRLELLRVLADAPNLLLLDEPTNDLDLDTLAVLEDYLDTWPGTLVVASHDRYFLDRVCDLLFSIEPDGRIRHHPGGWSAYQAARTARRDASRRAPRVNERQDAPRPTARPVKLGYNERRELKQLERRLAALEARKAELTQSVQEAGADYGAAQERSAALAQVLEELEAAEQRWLEISMIGEDG